MADLEIKLPAVVTITNTTDPTKDGAGKYTKGGRDIGFVPYRENFTVYVKAGDTLKIEAETAGQVLYYLAQKTDGLTVTQTAKSSS